MTKSQEKTINTIKNTLMKAVEDKNREFNSDSIVFFEEISETEYFAELIIRYQYDSQNTNIYNDQSMQLFIYKKGKIKGEKRRFGNAEEIKKFWQIYF